MMLSSYPLWWLALPVLLLPVWWHRQKRQRLKAEPLATARFLPSAAPEQLRVWRWRDRLLLLVRCLMLVTLIAWLAATIFPWRGDTVLLDAGVDKAWAEQQITAAGMSAAQRIELPPNGLQWLRQHERDWRPSARLLIVARGEQIAMPARVPPFSHQVELRTKLPPAAAPTAAASAAPAGPLRGGHHIVLAGAQEQGAAWRSLLAAFARAGDGAERYTLAAEPATATELIIWESPSAPPANWRAPHWWLAAPSPAFPELANASTLNINGLTLKYADSPRGRLWTSDAFPPRDADTARALYEAWQQLSPAPAPAYPMPSQTLGGTRSALPAITDAKPAAWLALVLLALFLLERILSHARRS
ncbi:MULTISPECIES: BatA domain-containing protein [unclassified Duganella]|uniref:BatA domain-containing protein n=1 Tax=unclassified Duganella TaxID=2636909 RepID=UPI001E43CAF2|nr:MULTISPECIES: BatA domain-containing protein [unclassified Duganella]